MSRLLPRLMCLVLAAVLSIGGVATHAGAVLHAAPGHGDSATAATDTGHLAATVAGHAEDTVFAASGCDGSGHGPGGICLEAQCCAPAVQMASQDVARPGFESGKRVIGVPDNYALSVAYSLLKPPRAIA